MSGEREEGKEDDAGTVAHSRVGSHRAWKVNQTAEEGNLK